jgi:hypothetical protein
MTELLLPLLIAADLRRYQLIEQWANRDDDQRGADRGLGTLELVIITLGLVTVAGVLVAAISGAVNARTSKIK